MDRVKVGELLEEIQELSQMKFLYNVKDIDLSRVVSVKVFEQPLSKVLVVVFKNTGVHFQIQEKQVVLYSDGLIGVVKTFQEVTGQVTGEDGLPIPGVTVMVKNSQRGTITDIDGYYSLDVDEGDTLVYRFVGYATREISVPNDLEGL